MITVWLITKARYADSAFNGVGAKLEGGRWNLTGDPMIYTAESLSLAALEMIVHLPEESLLYTEYVRIPASFHPRMVRVLPPEELPVDWSGVPPSESTRKIGSRWTKSHKGVILKVPSSIVPLEHNFLINPIHPDFQMLRIGKPAPFQFDPRIVKS